MYPTDVPNTSTSPTTAWARWLNNGGTGWVLSAIPLALMAWFLSMLGPITAGEVLTVSYPWVTGLNVSLAFAVDGLSLLFAIIVSGVGALVVIYAGGYMAGDPQIGRFFLYLFLFMFAMLGLVLANNVIALFVFWELTSITSFLLIGFKHKYAASRAAALQALLVTGLGGLILMAGLVLLALVGGSWEISTLLQRGDIIQASPLYPAILTLVLIGAFTKSAQFPFHFWLPGAMAAPTPVSSYLHSATMVKAGIYLLARFSPALGGTVSWQIAVTGFGAVTMLVGAYLAVIQVDLKRILAFTTVSGLGTLTMLLGIGTELAIQAMIVFLVVHALYKASLFMAAGAVDHETGTRDITALGGLRGVMPFTGIATAMAALSMSGLPPFFGFVGKELIYETTLYSDLAAWLVTATAVASKTLLMVAAGMVAILPFLGERTQTPKHAHEAPVSMWLGPMLLASTGLLLGLLPGSVDAFFSQSVGAILNEEVDIHLHLFPSSITSYFILSMITIAAGAAIYYGSSHFAPGILRTTGQPLRQVLEVAPERGYDAALAGMQAVARWQTRVLQSGYLRYYVLIIMSFTIIFVGYALTSRFDFSTVQLGNILDATIYEWLIAAITLAGALFLVRAQRRLTAVAALGAVGFGVTFLFLLNSAPDLAMTQFAIETLSVILFVLVIYRLPRFTTISSAATRFRDAIIALAVGALMTGLVLAVNAQRGDSLVSPYFAENSYTEAHGRNVVNVILVDFRALDTMGEIAVIAIAAIGIFTLLKLRTDDKAADDQAPDQPDPPAEQPHQPTGEVQQ